MSPQLQIPVPQQQSSSPKPTISQDFSPEFHNFQHDSIFLTEDHVLFYVQSALLWQMSGNVFQSILAQSSILVDEHHEPLRRVPERSDVLNLILHAVYFRHWSDHSYPFQSFVDAVTTMRKYEIEPALHLVPTNPFFLSLLNFAPLVPYELYALAAQFDIYYLAAAASSHLLSRPVSAISDELAERIGAVYLKRLLVLHQERMNALKGFLLQQPNPHPPNEACNVEAQRKLISAWALVAANLAWTARPDLSASMISSSFSHLNGTFSCQLCQQALQDWVQDVVARWANVKCTI